MISSAVAIWQFQQLSKVSPKLKTVWTFLALAIVYTRPLLTATVQYPEPMMAFHACLGPPSGHLASHPFSAEIPFRCGPRHWDQSPAPRRAPG